jgi:hypothetical protein
VRSSIVIGLAVLVGVAEADTPPPLYGVELKVGYGVEMGGNGAGVSSSSKSMTDAPSSSGMVAKTTPITISGILAIAIREQPWINAYGGMVAETIDRNAIGAVAGLQLPISGTPLRVAGGATYMFAPFTLWGATASVGTCKRFSKLGICGDLQLTSYFAGTDLADGRTVTQVQAAIGVVFDAM